MHFLWVKVWILWSKILVDNLIASIQCLCCYVGLKSYDVQSINFLFCLCKINFNLINDVDHLLGLLQILDSLFDIGSSSPRTIHAIIQIILLVCKWRSPDWFTGLMGPSSTFIWFFYICWHFKRITLSILAYSVCLATDTVIGCIYPRDTWIRLWVRWTITPRIALVTLVIFTLVFIVVNLILTTKY